MEISLFLIIFGFVVGVSLGSFVKVLADRSLSYKSFFGRSKCLGCKKSLPWYDLVPIFSYFILKGRCRNCHLKIGLEYVAVEAMVGILVAFLVWLNLLNIQFFINNPAFLFSYQLTIFASEMVASIFFICVLIALALTDLKKMLIPDRIIFPALTFGFIFSGLVTVYKVGYLYYHLSTHPVGKYLLPPYSDYFQNHAIQIVQPFLISVISALLIGGFFYVLIIITRGKGMGGGDVKLGAFMGIMLGFPNAFIALVLAFFSGALVSVFLITTGKKRFGNIIPFGPFLVLGSLIALFWGDKIFDWYIHLSF